MNKLFFIFFIFSLGLFSQNPNDCVNSIISCGNSNLSLDVSGVGTQELAGSNTCSSQENNSLWIKVTIATSGTLGFRLTPGSTAITEDYDFFVFGPDVVCGNIGSAIRCSTTNPQASGQANNLTGMNTSETDTAEGPGVNGNSFVRSLDVLVGESYFFVIDRPIGNSPFNLTWTGTATFADAPQNNLPIGTNLNLEECDGNNDGMATFDLTAQEAPLIGTQNVTASYHTSISDAQIGINPITTPNTYNASTSIAYIRLTDNLTECFSVFDINLSVLNTISLTQPPNLELCDIGNDNTETFNLLQQNNILTGSLTNVTISYHTEETHANLGTNSISTNFILTSNPQTIWARLVNNSTGCHGITSFLLTAQKTPIANQVQNWLACDTDNDGFFTFDLFTRNNQVLNTQNATDFTISYHKSITEAINNTAQLPQNYTNTIAYTPEFIFIRIENNLKTDCFDTSIIPFEIQVFDTPTANLPNDYMLCDTTNDGDDSNGLTTFNLNSITPQILGAQSNLQYIVRYYETQIDADNRTNQLPNNYLTTTPNNQTIIARIEHILNTNCFDTTPLELITNALPIVNDTVDFYQCDEDTDGFALMNLEEINALISTETNTTFTYFLTANNANNNTSAIVNFNTFSNNTASQVFCRVENSNGCFRVSQIDLHVSVSQIPNSFHLDYFLCDTLDVDNDDANGIATFNFSNATSLIENLFPSNQNILVTYYENTNDALLEINAISDITNYRNTSSPNTQNIIVRVDNLDNNSCLGLGEYISLLVNPVPEFTVTHPTQVCTGETITASIVIDNSSNSYSFTWRNATEVLGTNSTLDITKGGEYFVNVRSNSTGCSSSKSIQITESEKPILNNIIITDFNKPNNSVLIATSGIGEYEYKLDHTSYYTFEDDRNYQDTNRFTNLQPGTYNITIRDKNNCGFVEHTIHILDYPKFLTPNNDAIFDTWQIYGVEFLPNAHTVKTTIFDRYGKVLKQLNAYDYWNGTFKNQPLPKTDYWFRTEFINTNGKLIIKNGHFSLIVK